MLSGLISFFFTCQNCCRSFISFSAAVNVFFPSVPPADKMGCLKSKLGENQSSGGADKIPKTLGTEPPHYVRDPTSNTKHTVSSQQRQKVSCCGFLAQTENQSEHLNNWSQEICTKMSQNSLNDDVRVK